MPVCDDYVGELLHVTDPVGEANREFSSNVIGTAHDAFFVEVSTAEENELEECESLYGRRRGMEGHTCRREMGRAGFST